MPYIIYRFNLEESFKSISPSLPKELKQFIQKFIHADFFEVGAEEKMEEFRKDYLSRRFLCEGHFLGDYFPGKATNKIRDDEIIAKLAELFCCEQNANAIIEANTQVVGMIACNLLLAKIQCSSKDDILKTIRYPNEFTTINLSLDKKSKKVNLICTYSQIPIQFSETSEGVIPGPIISHFSLTKRFGKFGFQLDKIETNDDTIKNILLDSPTPLQRVIAAYKPRTIGRWEALLTGKKVTEDESKKSDSDAAKFFAGVAVTAVVAGGWFLLTKNASGAETEATELTKSMAANTKPPF
jgi:hypothetical protein